jgi:hypothetical protein
LSVTVKGNIPDSGVADVEVATLDLATVSETTYHCPMAAIDGCKWKLTCAGQHDDEKVRAALRVHLRVHKRKPEGCPPYLDTMHMLDRGEWWITEDHQIVKMSELSDSDLENAVLLLQRRAALGIISTYFPFWLKEEPEEVIDRYEREIINDPLKELQMTPTYKALMAEQSRRTEVSLSP